MPSANTHVFTGLDGAISVAVESGPEGDAAKAVNDAYGLTPVGRATGVTVQVTSDMKPFHELGQRYATELRPGNVNISGSIARAHVNGALLKLMLGEGAGGTRPAGAFVSPSFNLSLRLENQGFPGNSATVTVHGVKLDGWSYDMPEDDFVLEQVTFRALWISGADTSA
ncbi:MAG: hypothetical protein E6G08_00345 [Actinobacteria bacterium]|nr:MAG: hypothetical protein E6G08_00345 [Actinomycetota bacterium]